MFDGAMVGSQMLTYRSDSFTAASWVTQAAKLKKEDLEKIDLLKRVQHKLFLTPEMATVFRGDPDVLTRSFSVITRVLDGQGSLSDSGTHGRRGYQGDYLFAWIECTTPFGAPVWKVMGQLGADWFSSTSIRLPRHQSRT